jgi:hypothetical protein
MIGAFLSSNSFFGLMESMDRTEKSTPGQVFVTVVYFIATAVSFSCSVTVAVCSEFVVFYGWEKAMKGRREEMTMTIKQMYKFRLVMVKVLGTAVFSSMIMAGTLQMSRGGTSGDAPYHFSAIILAVILGFTIFMLRFSREILNAFDMGPTHWTSEEAMPSLPGPQAYSSQFNREDYVPYGIYQARDRGASSPALKSIYNGSEAGTPSSPGSNGGEKKEKKKKKSFFGTLSGLGGSSAARKGSYDAANTNEAGATPQQESEARRVT